jgi:hypothetical protein
VHADPTCCNLDWGFDVSWRPGGRHNQIILMNASDAHKFVAVPGVAACQAKMVLGFACARPQAKLSTRELAAKAASIIRERIAFVGLQEHWVHTVCLWHARFGGAVRHIELLDSRPTARDFEGPNNASLSSAAFGQTHYNEAALGDFVDVADEAAYAAASARFWQEVNTHYPLVQDCVESVQRSKQRARWFAETGVLAD